jgi:predicted Fe-Mo cluster-binding NifX family protein
MKIAITSTGPTLDDSVESRFGRCAYFLLIDPETLSFEAIRNPNIALGGGAGTQSAQLMANKGASVVLTGNCGPNAFRVFGAAGIQIITGVSGRVRDAVHQFKAGGLTTSSAPNVESHFGMGMGTGMGMGMGRRCGGGGGGGGLRRFGGIKMMPGDNGFSPSNTPSQKRQPEKEQIESLKEMALDLRNQLQAIENRIRDLDHQ